MSSSDLLSVFDVADDRRDFLEYLAYLHAMGVRPARSDWLGEVAEGLLKPESPVVGPPVQLDQAWTLERRRLLVVLTWPYTHGELTPRLPIPGDQNGWDSGIAGVYGRTYGEVWAAVRLNFQALEHLAKWRGSWDSLADQLGLQGDVLEESARLSLIETRLGHSVSRSDVSSLRADVEERLALACKGFLLSWWDIVAVGESTGFSFEPENDAAGAGRDVGTSGKYFWDRAELIERISKAAHIDRVKSGLLAQVDAEIDAVFSPEFEPRDLHRRITANGRIVPPAMGSKYRAMFERLDSEQASVRISREELDVLTSRAESNATRIARGSQGRPGLPNSALHSPQWWYGPWNPDVSGSSTVVPGWSEAMGKKSQSRAWIAAGFRAKPIFRQRTLTAVQFESTTDRQYWWPWRDELRAGSFGERVTCRRDCPDR